MKAIDLTRGSIPRGICAFSLPLLITSVVQQLYSTVDLLFVGNVLGTAAAAALGSGAMLLTLLAGLFTGISIGVNVKIANLVGAEDAPALWRATPTIIVLTVVGGSMLAIVGELFAAPFVVWMSIPHDAAGLALDYLRFAVAAALPIALYNVVAGALRGFGDSRSPLVAQLIGGFANICANWLALCVLQWGIIGCAFATFASNLLAAIIGMMLLKRTMRGWVAGHTLAKPYPDTARPAENEDVPSMHNLDFAFAWRVFAFGLPIGVQTVAITLSNIAVQYQVDLLGVQSVAAFAIYLKVELPIYFAILAIGQATTTFVAQNKGAGLHARCAKGIRICQVLCIAIAAALSAIMLALGYWAFWVFDHDVQVIGIGLVMIRITFPFYFFYAILEVQADAMRGFGHSLLPALIVLANICVLRIVLVWSLCVAGGTIEAIAATYPITWASTALCLVVARMGYIRVTKGQRNPVGARGDASNRR